MARTGYKKSRKEEHSKVKLKGSKESKGKVKKLPKGTNVTDTSFKVKKIVIKDQLKQHGEDEILTRKNLSCKDLASRLTHHNNSMKHEAITGLKELMASHASELIDSNLPLLIDSVPKLILDMSSEVRKSGIKLLTIILSQIKEPSRQLGPLFPLLSSYLICGLTNINQFVREDSLHLLDSILKHCPGLCVNAIPTLLPVCLDLMSNNSTGSRTLSLNLDSKLSSEVWRGNVLARIWTLLKALFTANTVAEKDKLKPKTIFVSKDSIINEEKTYLDLSRLCPVYSLDFKKQKLSMNKPSFYSKENAGDLDLKEFAEALIPLLFESFIEMVPPKEVLDEARTVTNISSETALNMKFIAEIIQLIWNLLEIQPGSEEKLNWMKTKFGKTFTTSFIKDRFPYSVDFEYNCKKKRTKNSNFLLGSIEEDGCSPHCLLQNLTLTHLILLLAPSYLDTALSYLKDCLRNSSDKFSQEESSVVVACLSRICSHYPTEVKFCLESLNKLSNSSNVHLKLEAFNILYSIVDDKNLSHLHSDPSFESWLISLPKRLTKQSITSEEILIIYDIARRQKFDVFCKELDAYIEVILDNVVGLKIINEDKEEEARRRVMQLLNWVREWDEELGASLEEGVKANYWGERLTSEVRYLLAARQEKMFEAPPEEE